MSRKQDSGSRSMSGGAEAPAGGQRFLDHASGSPDRCSARRSGGVDDGVDAGVGGVGDSVTLSTANMQIPAAGSTPVTATVRNSQGQPVSGAQVSFTGPGGSLFSASPVITDGAGQAVSQLDLGTPWATPVRRHRCRPWPERPPRRRPSPSSDPTCSRPVAGTRDRSRSPSWRSRRPWWMPSVRWRTCSPAALTSRRPRITRCRELPDSQLHAAAAQRESTHRPPGSWRCWRTARCGHEVAMRMVNWATVPPRIDRPGRRFRPDRGDADRRWGADGLRAAVGRIGARLGDNQYGQSAAGAATPQPSPFTVQGLPARVTQIAVGLRHVVALMADGSVMAWGGNSVGQLGDGTNTDRSTPTP